MWPWAWAERERERPVGRRQRRRRLCVICHGCTHTVAIVTFVLRLLRQPVLEDKTQSSTAEQKRSQPGVCPLPFPAPTVSKHGYRGVQVPHLLHGRRVRRRADHGCDRPALPSHPCVRGRHLPGAGEFSALAPSFCRFLRFMRTASCSSINAQAPVSGCPLAVGLRAAELVRVCRDQRFVLNGEHQRTSSHVHALRDSSAWWR